MSHSSFRPLGQSASAAEEGKEEEKNGKQTENNNIKTNKKRGTGGHRCDQDVTTPGLVSGAALAGVGDGEPKHSCCLPLLSQRVAAR